MKNKNRLLLREINEIVPRLKTHIAQYGYRPEHHFWLYLYELEAGYELVYFDFGKLGGVAANKKGRRWYISEEPIAPRSQRVSLFLETLQYIFAAGGHVSVEDWTEEFKNEFGKALRRFPHKMKRPNTVQYCPVINLEKFDETLSGGRLKGLRYVRNHFAKKYIVAVKDATEVSTSSLLNLLSVWSARRTARDKVWASDYRRFIEAGFPGCDIKRVTLLDGVLRGLSVGWRVPNTDNYYVYMDIHDYSDEYLGEFVSLDHILEAKKLGYKYVDFGGSDKGLLNFKKKFHPEHVYKTYNFSII